jgi:hypothetical protein
MLDHKRRPRQVHRHQAKCDQKKELAEGQLYQLQESGTRPQEKARPQERAQTSTQTPIQSLCPMCVVPPADRSTYKWAGPTYKWAGLLISGAVCVERRPVPVAGGRPAPHPHSSMLRAWPCCRDFNIFPRTLSTHSPPVRHKFCL